MRKKQSAIECSQSNVFGALKFAHEVVHDFMEYNNRIQEVLKNDEKSCVLGLPKREEFSIFEDVREKTETPYPSSGELKTTRKARRDGFDALKTNESLSRHPEGMPQKLGQTGHKENGVFLAETPADAAFNKDIRYAEKMTQQPMGLCGAEGVAPSADKDHAGQAVSSPQNMVADEKPPVEENVPLGTFFNTLGNYVDILLLEHFPLKDDKWEMGWQVIWQPDIQLHFTLIPRRGIGSIEPLSLGISPDSLMTETELLEYIGKYIMDTNAGHLVSFNPTFQIKIREHKD